jgi:mono/diheme cytochrome c family protein
VWQTAGGNGCQSCHGANGKGGTATDGTTAPNVTSATEQKLRDALRGGAALMTNLKLSDQEIEAVLVYLQYLDQQ